MNLYTSNNLNFLAERLGNVLFEKKKDPLVQETIIVQSIGMQRWISLKLAQQFGVLLNCNFPFPQKFAEDVFKAVIPEYQLSSLYEPQSLVWTIMRLLQHCINEKPFQHIKQYVTVSDVISYIRLFQLSQKLAYMYDEYIVYYCNDIVQWENENNDEWQIMLWKYIYRSISIDPHDCHKAHLLNYFLEALKNGSTKKALKAILPERIFLFGITALPEYYIMLFKALSSFIDVHIFQLNPSKEYWFDIRSEQSINRIKKKLQEKKQMVDDFHFETGNPLLASFGTLGREYIGLLLDYDAAENINDETQYQIGNNDTLLGHIQSDICCLINRGKDFNAEKIPIKTSDDSIAIHSCHSPLREVEVLRDYIYHILNNEDIVPNDIVVMAPDIERYSPFIAAVFDEVMIKKEGLPLLPYTIADQSFKTASRYISAFIDLLDALTGRMEADIVIELLDYDEIATVFAISKQDVAIYQDWVSRANVRWGKDTKHREQFTQKESNAFTWQYAIERFLMGYAVPENTGIIDDILPFDCVEGMAAQRLGNFIMFLKTLFSFHTIAGQKHSISAWANILEQLISSLLVNSDAVSNDIVFVQSLIQQLVATSAKLQITDEIDFIVIKDWINTYLAEQRVSTNFLRKGITFCQFLPMRSIPFQVVCLLGMNDGQFPRIDERLSFDILKNKEKQPRCVRSKRNDDRYLFLESMLSAQKKLFISYEGQSPVDLSLKQPSIVVAELMDYIEQGFTRNDTGQSISDFIVTNHHLHRFNSNYFNNDSKKYSYSKLSYHESKACYGSKHKYQLFAQTPVVAEQMTRHITVEDFISFFKNPARYFIKNVLGISLAENVNDIASDEPFSINGLERYQLTNELCQRLINGGDSYGYKVLLQKQGKLPDGDLGDIIFEDAQSQVMDFVEKVRRKLTCDAEQHELHYTSASNDLVITGNPYLYAGQQIYYRYATIKPDDRLHALLWHLFVCATQSDECNDAVTTILIGRDKDKYKELTYQHIAKEKSINYLEQLVSIFMQGQSTILPFFPKTSYEYYNSTTDGKNSKSRNAIYKARDAFYGDNGYESIDYDDPYIKRAFYKVDIFDDEKLHKEFDYLSQTIFGIVKDYESEEKESQ